MEKLRLDVNLDVSLEEQKEAGIKYLRRHCLEFLETARTERRARMEHARDSYLEEVRLREQEELQRKKEKNERLARMDEEIRLAEVSRRREEEEEEVRLENWSRTYFHLSGEILNNAFSFITNRLHRRRGAMKKKKMLHLLLLQRMKRPSALRSDVPLPRQLRLSA